MTPRAFYPRFFSSNEIPSSPAIVHSSLRFFFSHAFHNHGDHLSAQQDNLSWAFFFLLKYSAIIFLTQQIRFYLPGEFLAIYSE
jgi:hypothetical protein